MTSLANHPAKNFAAQTLEAVVANLKYDRDMRQYTDTCEDWIYSCTTEEKESLAEFSLCTYLAPGRPFNLTKKENEIQYRVIKMILENLEEVESEPGTWRDRYQDWVVSLSTYEMTSLRRAAIKISL